MKKAASPASLGRRPSFAHAIPLLGAPFLSYIAVRVFDLGDAAMIAGTVLGALLGLAILPPSPSRLRHRAWRGKGAWRIGLALAVMVACAAAVALVELSVLRRSLEESGPAAEHTLPVYSFDAARGNYHAFIAWWTKYVNAWEQVRLQIETPRVEGGRHVPRPNAEARFLEGTVRTNNMGFRGRDIPAEKGEDYRIFTLGASNTFGQNVFRDSLPWPAVLDRLIAERLHCRRPIQVINAGVNAYDIRKVLARVREDIAPLKPDMLLSYTGWAEIKFILEDLPQPQRPRFAERILAEIQRGDVATGVQLLTLGSAQYRFDLSRGLRLFGARLDFTASQVATRLAGMAYAAERLAGLGEAYSLQEIRESELAGLYRELIAESRRQDAKLVLTSVNLSIDRRSPLEAIAFYAAVFHNLMPGTTYLEAVIRGLELNRLLLQELAAAHDGVAFIDVSEGLEGVFDRDYYIDIAHFTAAGDRKMAENVYAGLAPMLRADPTLQCRER